MNSQFLYGQISKMFTCFINSIPLSHIVYIHLGFQIMHWKFGFIILH